MEGEWSHGRNVYGALKKRIDELLSPRLNCSDNDSVEK